jgi:hypothetical protein
LATPNARKEPTMPQLTSRERAPTAPVPTANGEAVHLRRLVDTAGVLDLDDRRGWMALTVEAAALLEQLTLGGRISPALVISPLDPPVVVARALASASRSLPRSDASHP